MYDQNPITIFLVPTDGIRDATARIQEAMNCRHTAIIMPDQADMWTSNDIAKCRGLPIDGEWFGPPLAAGDDGELHVRQ